LSTWFEQLSSEFEGKKESKVFGKGGFLPNKEEWGGLWEGIKKLLSPEAKADTATDAAPDPDAESFANRFGEWTPSSPIDINVFREKFETSKDSTTILLDIYNFLSGDEHSGMGGGGGGGGGGFSFGSQGSNASIINPNATGAAAGGIDPKGGGRSGYNYFQHRGDAPIRDPSSLAVIDTKWGKLRVHPEAAEGFKNFYGKLAEAGAPVGTSGTYNLRQKRWGGGWSSHAYAAAHDIGNSQFFSPAMKQWILENPDKWREAMASGNVGQPLTDRSMVGGKDPAHIEWKGPLYNPDGTIRKYQPQEEDARKRIDQSFPSPKNRGSARVDVDFTGVPKGVSTNAELLDQGIFSTLNIHKAPARPQVPN
jgi:hypothetical protein